MRINIENCVRNCGANGIYKGSLTELVENLKELRQRTAAGDMTALDEFFRVYVFDADSKPSNALDEPRRP